MEKYKAESNKMCSELKNSTSNSERICVEVKNICEKAKPKSVVSVTGCSGLPQVSNKAYADIVKGGAPVTVKPKERQKCMVTKEDLEKNTDPTDLKIVGIKNRQNGALITKSENQKETKKIKKSSGGKVKR